MTAPSFLWLAVLFFIPTILVVLISFRTADPFGGIGNTWALESFRSIARQNYGPILLRTVLLSIYTTAICLVLGIPVAYYLARCKASRQQNLLLLIIIPFWTSFLIRIYAWKVLLHPDGIIKQILMFLHLVDPDAILLYNQTAVLLVLVYTYLPFAILPLYSAAEKFDFTLMEAALDLGSSRATAFAKIFIPGISAGIMSALLVVFIPALGSYIIPEIVGGPTGEMLGNKIAQRVFVDRNLPHASALSTLLVLAVLVVPMFRLIWRRVRNSRPQTPDEAAFLGGQI
ncbi:MAG: ABC transporter permease [Spirochaetaceae bacterium]|nr:MAG: ABC transporter permease [Spirochaetaceae bacterium]